MYGFHGRLLHIDLSSGQSSWSDLEQSRLRAFLGGIGLGTSLLYDYAPPGVDPFSPANPLIFASAPLVGTGLTTTAKFAVVTKSPLTGFIADSLSSSYFALELKRIGLDALIITGRAAAMAYIFIENEKVEIRAAEHLRGKSPLECESLIRGELDVPTARIAAIGKAGENSPARCASAVWALLPTSIEKSARWPIWRFLTASALCPHAIFSNQLLTTPTP